MHGLQVWMDAWKVDMAAASATDSNPQPLRASRCRCCTPDHGSNGQRCHDRLATDGCGHNQAWAEGGSDLAIVLKVVGHEASAHLTDSSMITSYEEAPAKV